MQYPISNSEDIFDSRDVIARIEELEEVIKGGEDLDESACAAEPEKILRTRELCARWGVCRSTLWRWRKNKVLPEPIRFSSSFSGWRLSDILRVEREHQGTRAA